MFRQFNRSSPGDTTLKSVLNCKLFYLTYGSTIFSGLLLGKKVKLSLYLTNEVLRHEGVWGSGCIDPHFLDLGSSWR
jgi:hypothetical protein